MALGSLGAALYHALAATGLISGDGSPALRHTTFVVIDAVGAWLLVRRPRWLVFPAALLTVQQCGSHGSRVVRWWQADHVIDWVSVTLLAALSVTVVLLWWERQHDGAAPLT